jgi:hypothetical protein
LSSFNQKPCPGSNGIRVQFRLETLSSFNQNTQFERFTIASPNSQQRKIVAKRLFEQTFIAFDIDDEALNLVARLDLGLRELRRVMSQCGERLVMELRRIGHDTPSSGADRPVVRELHVREVIRENNYRLSPIREVEFDRA